MNPRARALVSFPVTVPNSFRIPALIGACALAGCLSGNEGGNDPVPARGLGRYAWKKAIDPDLAPRPEPFDGFEGMSAALDPSGRLFVTYAETNEQGFAIYDPFLDSARKPVSPPCLQGLRIHGDKDLGLGFFPDGKAVGFATVADQESFLVFGADGCEAWTHPDFAKDYSGITWSPVSGGRILAMYNLDTTFHRSEAFIRVLVFRDGTAAAFGPDIPSGITLGESILEPPGGGVFLAWYDSANHIRVYRKQADAWEPLTAGLEGVRGWNTRLAAGPDGSVHLSFGEVATAGKGMSVFRWDGAAWKPVGARGFGRMAWHNGIFFSGDTLLAAYVDKHAWKTLHAYGFDGSEWRFLDSVEAIDHVSDEVYPVRSSPTPYFVTHLSPNGGFMRILRLERIP